MVWKRWSKILLVAGLILLPVAVSYIYRRATALPEVITIATGPPGGRYRDIAASLAEEIERLGVRVHLRHTRGSLDNLRLLERGEADLALYQPHTRQILRPEPPQNPPDIAFVANVYSEVLHFVVREGVTFEGPWSLRGKAISLGPEGSGDYAMSLVLLEHLGLDLADIEPRQVDFLSTRAGLESGEIDAAFLTVGERAPFLRELFADVPCRIHNVPYPDALASNHVPINRHTIPAGLYHVGQRSVPPVPIETVAVRAQLLARSDLPSGLVEQVAGILTRAEFLKENHLGELFDGGEAFARGEPEFALHPGAAHFYDPELRPLLNSEFVEATEGLRSFLVSVLIAAFLVFRWLKTRRERRMEHRLDRYIRAVLDLERRQMDLDEGSHENISALNQILDELTNLRQKALGVFSTHELNEDRAVDCFLEMCHALSDKVNAKLSRAHLEQQVSRIEAALRADRDFAATSEESTSKDA